MATRWTRQHEAARAAILESLERDARPFEDMSDDAQKARRALPALEWCSTYLPHYFTAAFSLSHQRMWDSVGEPAMPTFDCAFRGFGKSVLLSLAKPLKLILDRAVPFIVFGSQVQLLAAQLMDYVRIELEHNPRIRADYGTIRVDGPAEAWVAHLPKPRVKGQFSRTSVKCQGYGIGMSPRGVRHGEHRPYVFVGDDLEDAQLARSPRREQQLWDWMMDEVVPALEPEVWQLWVVGTMFGPGCMMERAREAAGKEDPAGRPLAKTFTQAAMDAEGRSAWPARFSDEALARIRAMIGLRNWNRNFALTADDPSKPFQPGWFLETYDKRPDGLRVFCFLDPAFKESAGGCPRALVAIGADAEGRRYVLDAWIETGAAMEMVTQLFGFFRRWRPRLMGIEENGGATLIKPLLGVEEARRGFRLPVTYKNHTRAKEARIEELVPEMQTGRWLWPARPSTGVRTLQDQFLAYPDGYVDGPDAAAGCCQDLGMGDAWRGRASGPFYKSLGSRRSEGLLAVL